nr:MAG TPA: hypothetical protein [Caudoviricetes sp.]
MAHWTNCLYTNYNNQNRIKFLTINYFTPHEENIHIRTYQRVTD